MANVKDKMVQQGQAVVYREAGTNFGLMAAALKKDKAIDITIEQSYLSIYDVADELRKIVKDKTAKEQADIKVLLDTNKAIADIIKEGQQEKLITYLDSLTPADYEPPLPADFTSPTNATVKQFPNRIKLDPRRTGRLVKPGPTDSLKSLETQKWLINNSVLYGFVMYADNGLYYMGVDAIKNKVKAAANKQEELLTIINRFMKTAVPLDQLSLTAQKVLDNKLPSIPAATDPGNLETIPNHSVLSNSGTILDLVVLHGQPVWRPVALAYLEMEAAAKNDGITLRISSGFRPATGPNVPVTTSKGRSISMTTQETLRKQKSRWRNRDNYKYNGAPATDDQFIMFASSDYFKPATAPPKSSRHGDGTALDMNTGGRDDFAPLDEPIYTWLIKNSYKFGFIRTVSSEEWHYEYLPDFAKNGPYSKLSSGSNVAKFYTDLGLSKGQFTV